jgi:predicted flap endonuclease-1-like 5' DNA nuclease/predicted  nucleic acid-binding Zn-ribbon protein
MSEFFNTIFNELTSGESLWLIFFHIVAWLIGLLVGYWLWGRHVSRLKSEAVDLNNRIKLLEGKNSELSADLEKRNAQIGELSGELDIEREKNKLLENEKGDLHTELLLVKSAKEEQNGLILKLNNDKDSLNAQLSKEAISYKSSISGLNADLDARTANLTDLQAKIGKLETNVSAKVRTISDLEAKLAKCKNTNTQLNADLTAKTGNIGDLQFGIGKLEADVSGKATAISDLEAKIAELEGANAQLNTDLDARTGNIGDLQFGIGKLEADVSGKATVISDLEAKIAELEGANAQLNTDLSTNARDIGGLEAKISELESGNTQLNLDLNAKAGSLGDLEAKFGDLEGVNAQLNADLNAKAEGLGDLEAKLGQCKDANAQLNVDLDAKAGSFGDLEAKLSNLQNLNLGLQGDLDATVNDIGALKASIGSLEADVNAKADAINDLEAKVGDLEGLNAKLNTDLNTKNGLVTSLEGNVSSLNLLVSNLEKEKAAEANMAMSRSLEAKPVKLTKEEKIAFAAQAASEVKDLIGSHIPAATAADKDDLKIISGIGPFIEKKLNNLGIWTFEQISYFDKKMVGKVTDAIQFFPGRIERDDWISQAKELSSRDMTAAASASDKARAEIAEILNTAGTLIPMATAADKDDLKVIRGVGSFIETKLNNLGIWTYEQVSLFDKDFIDKVTDAIEFFPGRIERDNWVSQAKELFEAK